MVFLYSKFLPFVQLGDIMKMGPVVAGQGVNRKDKYLVLFPANLLLLSASNRLSAFLYEVTAQDFWWFSLVEKGMYLICEA